MKTWAFWNTNGIRTYSRASAVTLIFKLRYRSISPNIVRDRAEQAAACTRKKAGYKQKVEKWDSDSDSDASDDEKDLVQ